MWKFKTFVKESAGLEGRTIDVGSLKIHVRSAIAEGGFSCVYLAHDATHQSKQYALKHIICNDQESLDLVVKEISVMKLLKGHPNVVTLAASNIFNIGRRKEALLVMEFCEKSLVSVIESRGAGYFDEKQILLIFWDVCNAVFAMHCQLPPIAHRDLKAENVLLGPNGAWKLCDFGSTSTNHKCFDKPGEMGIEEDNIRKHTTPAYRAPEMWDLLRRDVLSEKVDIWALGCLLYRICYFKSAFDGESKLQVLNGNYRIPEMPKYTSSLIDLIKDMLQDSPDARPDITQVWFRVNFQLPEELQKETPDGTSSTAFPDLQKPALNVHDEGNSASARTHPMPRRSPPSPPSREHVQDTSSQFLKEERPPKTSLGASNVNGHGGSMGAFWATEHAPDTQVMEDKGPVFDEEPPIQNSSKHNQQNFGRRANPTGEQQMKQQPKRTDWANPLKNSDDGPKGDFEIRFDSDDNFGKTKISYSENQKIRASQSENSNTFQNESFNTFVADFDTSKLSAQNNYTSNSTSTMELETEVEKLKEELKQSNLEKAEVTSKYEKLSAICRSQRQEIQELKNALAALNQSPTKDVLKMHTASEIVHPANRPRDKIEGSVLELNQGIFSSASASESPDSKSWQPFAEEPKPRPMSKSNHPRSVRTTSNRHNKPTTSSGTTDSWGFGQDNFGASPPASQPPAQASNPQPLSIKEVKKVERTQPGGWAGF